MGQYGSERLVGVVWRGGGREDGAIGANEALYSWNSVLPFVLSAVTPPFISLSIAIGQGRAQGRGAKEADGEIQDITS
jgi:hypothetical protein